MARWTENPAYNVLSLRAPDDAAEKIRKAAGTKSVSKFLLEAALEKIRRDKTATGANDSGSGN